MLVIRSLAPLLLTYMLLGLAGAAHVHAQPLSTEELEVHRLRLQAEGHAGRGEHVACAETYLAINKQFPKAKGHDEILYNAGVCFEEGKSVGRAIQTFELLVDRFPRSRLAARAMLRIGSAAAGIANFEKAAQAYEKFARVYPGEKDAPSALAKATDYRRALGHNNEAIANIQRYRRNYQRRRREESASAHFSLAAIYEGEGDTKNMIESYKDYLKQTGARGGVDRILVANAKIGVALWEQSCSAATPDGSCVQVKRRKTRTGAKIPTHCGPESTVVQVLPRKPRLSKEARHYLDAGLSLSQEAARTAPNDERSAAARVWAGAALFYAQQQDFEALLSLRFPAGLDFVPGTAKAKESERRFQDWIETMRKESSALLEQYKTINVASAGVWQLAALARSGQNVLHFAKVLQGAEIPKSVRTGPYAADGVAAYCDALTSAAAPLEQQAASGFERCLALSQELDHIDQWTRLCQRELGLLRPEDFPVPGELRGVSMGTGEVLSSAPLLSPAPAPLVPRATEAPPK